jgi:hypothetical protein
MIGWYFNTDGVCTGYNGLVEDCFFKLNDDAVKLYFSNMTFKNITVDGPMKKPNAIKGWDSNHRVSNILFENVMVNGRYFTSAEDGNFEIDPKTTDNIQFKVTK